MSTVNAMRALLDALDDADVEISAVGLLDTVAYLERGGWMLVRVVRRPPDDCALSDDPSEPAPVAKRPYTISEPLDVLPAAPSSTDFEF